MFSSRIWLGFLIFTLVVNSIRSVHERVLNNQDRTNNYCEAAHKRMNRELCMEHPTLWKFIEGLKRVQKNRDKLYEEFVRGDEAAKNEWFTRKRMNASERLLWRDLGSVLLLNICVGLQQILIWINNFFAHFHVRSFIFCCFFLFGKIFNVLLWVPEFLFAHRKVGRVRKGYLYAIFSLCTRNL